MLPYFLLLLAISTLALASKLKNFPTWVAVSLIAALLILFSTLRFDVGVDYLSYANIYEEYTNTGEGARREPLFNLLMSLSDLTPLQFTLVKAVCALLFVGGFAFLITKYSTRPELSLFLFAALPLFYIASFNQMRQYAALGLLAFGVHFLIQRRPIPFFSTLLAGIGFHASVAPFLITYFFFHKRFPLAVYGIAVALVVLIAPYILDFIYMSGIYYTPYFTSQDPTEPQMEHALLLIGSSAVLALSLKYLPTTDTAANTFINFLFCLLPIILLVYTTDIAGLGRVTSLYAWPLLLLVPVLVAKITPWTARLMAGSLVIYLALAYFLRTIVLRGGEVNLIPYQSVF